MARPPSVMRARFSRPTVWPAIAVWAVALCLLGSYHRTRGKPGPNDDVYVCENYRACETRPIRTIDVDSYDWPVCDEGSDMDVIIKFRDWPHRWH